MEVLDATVTPTEQEPDLDLIGRCWYDGDGKRVKKNVPAVGKNPAEITIFAYDAAGKLVAEYSTIVASTNDAKVAYLTNDHLGSPRINTDKNGDTTAHHDYHPLGEEIACQKPLVSDTRNLRLESSRETGLRKTAFRRGLFTLCGVTNNLERIF